MIKRLLVFPVICLVILLPVGCEDDDYDHIPAPGMGAVVVDNQTSEDVELYVDGEYKGIIGDGHDRAFDHVPGVYRMVVAERRGDRNYRDDIDILEGRLTILKVRAGYDSYEYSVDIEFD